MFINPPSSICVLRLSAIGDVCHALPVVRTLQDRWPETHITWIIGRLEHTLVGDIPGIEFAVFDKHAGVAAYRTLWRQLNARRYDVLLHMQAALRASVASLGIHAPLRIGFDKARARDWQWLFTNRRIDARSDEHVMDGLFGFAHALGVDVQKPRWDIPLPQDAISFAESVIADPARALIISPCTSQRARNFRNWPAERYIALARYARDHHGMQVIVTGGPSELERDYGKRIAAAVDGVRDLAGTTSLKQLQALLARATVLVSPDSGPVHMANAAGTPVIGLYATSNPDRTGPYHGREWVVNRYPDAVKKYLGKRADEVRWGQRVRHPDAMELIAVDDVTAMLDRLMQSR